MLDYAHPVQLDKSFAGSDEQVTVCAFLNAADKNPGHRGLKLTATKPIEPYDGPDPQRTVAAHAKACDFGAHARTRMIEDRLRPVEVIQRRVRDADQAVAGPNPEIAVRPLRKCAHDALWRCSRPSKIDRREMSSVEAVEPSVRADP